VHEYAHSTISESPFLVICKYDLRVSALVKAASRMMSVPKAGLCSQPLLETLAISPDRAHHLLFKPPSFVCPPSSLHHLLTYLRRLARWFTVLSPCYYCEHPIEPVQVPWSCCISRLIAMPSRMVRIYLSISCLSMEDGTPKLLCLTHHHVLHVHLLSNIIRLIVEVFTDLAWQRLLHFGFLVLFTSNFKNL
jgi:hypothetical protein